MLRKHADDVAAVVFCYLFLLCVALTITKTSSWSSSSAAAATTTITEYSDYNDNISVFIAH